MYGKPSARIYFLRGLLTQNFCLKPVIRRDGRGLAHQKDTDPAVGRAVRIVGEKRRRAGLARDLEDAVRSDALRRQHGPGGVRSRSGEFPIGDAAWSLEGRGVGMAGNRNAV